MQDDTSPSQAGTGTSRGRLRVVPLALVVLALVAGATAYRLDLVARLVDDGPSPLDAPAEVAPPAGVVLPAVPTPEAVADVTSSRRADPRAVRRAVAGPLGDDRLGRRVAVAVAELADGRLLLREGPVRVTPASTLKLLTAAAALEALGPGHRFRTSVVTRSRTGPVVLVGGGDPLLASGPAPPGTYPPRADLETLADATARALADAGRSRIRLRYDASLFPGPGDNPRWEASYVPDGVVSPTAALWVDEGVEPDGASRSDDPARAAAEVFAELLRRREVRVAGQPLAARAPDGARELAAVEGAPLAQVVERVLDVSDNEGAEVLARQVAVAAGERADVAGARRAVRTTLTGMDAVSSGDRLLDGSGLSRHNLLAPLTLVRLLALAADGSRPELRSLLTGLPVAGFTGSLADRFATGSRWGPGAVRAKTGTLTGVHGLAGTVTTRDGVVLAFAATADRVRVADTLDARVALDRMAAALAGCRCASRSFGSGP